MSLILNQCLPMLALSENVLFFKYILIDFNQIQHNCMLSAPPGEEDEEEGVHNGYKHENGNGPARGDRNTQGGYSSYKRTRPYNNSSNTYGYGYGSLYNGQSKSSQAKNEEDPNKPKLVFNEGEKIPFFSNHDILSYNTHFSHRGIHEDNHTSTRCSIQEGIPFSQETIG